MWLFICFTGLFFSTANSDSFTAIVIGVKDGDTIEVLYNKKLIVVRIADIDCPEKKQPYGNAARKFTADFCFGKEITIIPRNQKDRYGRTLAEIKLGTNNLGELLVDAGLAWCFKYAKNPALKKLETQAKQLKKGLWVAPQPIAPWLWRKPVKKKRFNLSS